jgi:hypothetical protein
VLSFQKDAILRRFREFSRLTERLERENHEAASKNTLLADTLTAVGGWWTEVRLHDSNWSFFPFFATDVLKL